MKKYVKLHSGTMRVTMRVIPAGLSTSRAVYPNHA